MVFNKKNQMKNTLLILITFISINLYSQEDTIRETGFDAILSTSFPGTVGYDTTIFYHENGNIFYIEPTLNGIRHGIFQRWHLNGQLIYQGNYVNGKMDGIHRSYFDNGKIQMKSRYELGKMISQKFYYKNGRKSYFVTYKSNGLIVRSWYENGQKSLLERHKNGFPINCSSPLLPLISLDSSATNTKTQQLQENQQCFCNNEPVFYKNGVYVDSSNNPVNMNYKSVRKVWYENGELKSKYVYKNGERTYKEWDENGVLVIEENS